MQIAADVQFCGGAALQNQSMARMNQQLFEVGQRVDQWCATCSEERGQVVASISGNGRVTRISCPICGTRSTFKNNESVAAISKQRLDAQPYDREHAYRIKQLINHPTYGIGEVVALVEPQKIDVLFADRMRRLIHSRA